MNIAVFNYFFVPILFRQNIVWGYTSNIIVIFLQNVTDIDTLF